MQKNKFFRQAVGLCLAGAILCVSTFSISAEAPETAAHDVILREFSDAASATVDRGVNYDLSSLDLNTLPSYMNDSLGLSELSDEKQPISVTDLNAEDLYSFTTLNEDDTLTLYMFSEPVKFVDKDAAAIKFIDNSIKVKDSANGSSPIVSGSISASDNRLYTAKSYTNTANFFTVDMPSSVNQGISISYDDKKFTISPASASLSTAALKTAAFRGMREQVVEYHNALGDGIHLQYVPINNGVKENIILDKYPGKNTFNFIFDAGGYYPAYTEGEAVPFIDPATDKISLILGQADARDSYTGDETDGHFTIYNSLRVESLGNGKYTLTVTIDEAFLTDPDTVYPVIIDPSYTLPSTSFRDTTVYSGAPTKQNYYSSAYLVVGDHGTSYGEGIAFVQTKKMTDLISWGILPELVNFAQYRVYEGSGKTNYSMIRLYGTTANWDQTTITYNNKPDYDSGSIAMQAVDHSGWYTFDVTRHVKNFLAWAEDYSGYSQTRGFALAATDPTASSKHFCSGEYTGSTKPSMIINYTSGVYDINDNFRDKNGQLQPFKAWGKLINGSAPMFKFTVDTAGTYVMETLDSEGLNSVTPTDTMLQLFDSNLNRLAINDNANTWDTTFSRIQWDLSVGTYYLAVSDAVDSDAAAGTADSVGKVEDVKCYVIIEGFDEGENTAATGQGELNGTYKDYYVDIREFYKIGDEDTKSCLEYALNTDETGLGATSYDKAISIMTRYKYKEVEIDSDELDINNCIVSYGTDGDINHYAKIENGVVTAKINGNLEYVMHPDYNCYLATNHAVIRFFTYIGIE